jgi:hypothetical protein
MQVKLTIQGEAYNGVMLQQTVVVDFQARIPAFSANVNRASAYHTVCIHQRARLYSVSVLLRMIFNALLN